VEETTRERMRLLERALRPTATAVRHQAQVTAEGNDLLAAGHRLLTEVRADIAAQRAATDAVHQRLDNLEAVVTGMARAAGLIDTRNVDYDSWTVAIVAEALSRGGTGLDVGAHSGLILRSILASAPAGRHHAFEPIPELAAGLRRDFPAVTVHEVALSDAEGTVEFHHVTSNPSYSGIRRRSYTGPEDVELITVRAARLDDLVEEDLPVRFLKIDVEGGELGVLRGATRTLATHRPVTVFEFGRGASDVYGTTPRDIHDLFAGHGMALGLLDAYLDGRPPLTLAELEDEYDSGRNFYFVGFPADPAVGPARA